MSAKKMQKYLEQAAELLAKAYEASPDGSGLDGYAADEAAMFADAIRIVEEQVTDLTMGINPFNEQKS